MPSKEKKKKKSSTNEAQANAGRGQHVSRDVTEPILLRPPTKNQQGNVIQWKGKIEDFIQKEYGQLASFMRTGIPFIREKPIRPRMATAEEIQNAQAREPDNDEDEKKSDDDSSSSESSEEREDDVPVSVENNPFVFFNQDDYDEARYIYREQIKTYLKHVNDDKNAYTSIYAVMWSYINRDARYLLRRDRSFAQIDNQCDPVALWQLIQRKCAIVDNFNIDEVADFNTSDYFEKKLRQNEREHASDFKERFEASLAVMVERGLPVPSGSLAALKFLSKLDDSRHGTFKSDYGKDIREKKTPAPRDLDDVLNALFTFEHNKLISIKT